MTATYDPALLPWLASLGPRQELIMRLALRENDDAVRADRSFADRIKALLEALDPRPQEMAAILDRVREIEKNIALHLPQTDTPPPPAEKRR